MERSGSLPYNETVQQSTLVSPGPAVVLAALLRGRRSVRRYLEREVPRSALEAVLESIRWAPSPHNSQPWRAALLRSATARERLATALGERWRADLVADGLPAEAIDRLIGRSRERIGGAPAVLVLGLTLVDLDIYPDQQRQQAEFLMAAHSLGAAAQNVMLTAHAYGLASCWMCAPLFCPEVVREALELGPDVIPQALITLGYPALEPPPREKKPLGEIVLLDL
jgi:F420 biosynthesis protein FbiB-like protein